MTTFKKICSCGNIFYTDNLEEVSCQDCRDEVVIKYDDGFWESDENVILEGREDV